MKLRKKGKKVLAILMAALMVIGVMPMDWNTVQADAAGTTYVFESKDLAPAAAGTYTDGQEVKAGTSDYFTLIMSGKTKIDSSSKKWEDDYTSDQRLNFGGVASLEKNAVKIKTQAEAEVKIWWVEGGDDNRQMAILDSTGALVTKSAQEAPAKNAPYVSTLTIPAAGTYYIGGDINNNNIYKITVEEKSAEPVIIENTFESNALTPAAAGTYTDGQEVKAGTNDYFTLIMSAKTKIDSSSKTWEDDYTSDQRLNFGGVGSLEKNSIKFKTTGPATVKVWFVQGGEDNRQMAILDSAGTIVTKSALEGMAKNNPYICELKLDAAGTYYLGGETNNNNIYKVVVTETSGGGEVPRKDWADVADPVITSVELNPENAGVIVVNYDMVIGDDGADKIEIDVKDAAGTVLTTLRSSAEGTSGKREFTPEASGDYTFSIRAMREGEADKNGADKVFTGFALPLETPSFQSATSEGSGKVGLVWNSVKEATSYEVSYSTDGTTYSTPVEVKDTSYTVTGLTVGTKYTFKLVAKRETPAAVSDAATIEATATEEAQQVWAFSAFGQGVSSDSKNSGYSGSANDGSVKVWSLNNKGKLVPASTDGLSFYYTAIPTNMNFTLSAKVTIDKWTYTNGQEGFGLMAADRVGINGDSSVFWNNSYMNTITKVEYFADAEGNVTDDTTANKISMKLGIGSQEKSGVTKDNLARLEANDTDAVTKEFSSKMTTLDTSCASKGAGTYNIIGNYTNTGGTFTETVVDNKTTFNMTIQRNNTGYFVSYTDEAGNTVTKKYYDTEALDKLDSDNVYVGFFASRTCEATFSDIKLTTVAPEDDAPAEERPMTEVTPSYSVTSGSVANKEDYELTYVSNADGHVTIKDADGNVIADEDVKAFAKNTYVAKLELGKNEFLVTATPAEGYKPSEFEVLSSYDTVTFTHTVSYDNFDGDVIYVGPEGTSKGKGTKEDPVDVYTAVKYAKAGQYIVVLGGTYNLESTVKIERGIDGTAEAPIRMIREPGTSESERPVFDFGGNCEGMVIAGDYWYIQGFDVTNSMNGKDGIRLSGSNVTMDNMHTYHNGNTGLQISRYLTTDTWEDWPANNLVLNCTSWGNADAGYEDADGFAAKLTIGNGNVFDGCVAYNNADDGWDLFAKVETGAIGSVTIQNCVAYANGYLEDGTNAGNGNGFKMGGSSMTGYHKLINSVAFDNKAKGIDSNSCPDIQVTNCTSFNNGSFNVAFYTNDAANTDFMGTGILSLRTQFTDVAEQFKFKGNQDTTKVYNPTNYFWNYDSKGADDAQRSNDINTAEWVVSLDTKMDYTTHVYAQSPITRNADGTINMNDLLVLKEAAKAGAVMGGQASAVITLDGLSTTSGLVAPKTGDSNTAVPFVLMMILSAAMAAGVYFYDKKRKTLVRH